MAGEKTWDKPQLTKRDFLKMIAVGTGGVILGGAIDTAIKVTKVAFGQNPDNPQVISARFKALRESLGAKAHFPFDQRDIESVDLGPVFGKPEQVIKPSVLRDNFGIDIRVTKPDVRKSVLVDSSEATLFVRPHEEQFQQVFGFVWESPDPHLLRKIDIIMVQKSQLCGFKKFDPDISPFTDLRDWAISGMRKFRETLATNNLTLPPIKTANGIVNYDLSGANVEENVARLQEYEKRFVPFALEALSRCGLDSYVGYTAGGIVPEFNLTRNSEIITGPDGIPMITLRGRVYVALDQGDEKVQAEVEKGATPVVGGTIVHELYHLKDMFSDRMVLSEESLHREVFVEEATYVAEMKSKQEKGDYSGFLFIVRSPRGNFLT